ncbi:modin [Colletotrichum truncatum]|uniref:Modin n=1 Tax=Colletotrichum truncatum TaxID=5467 RepID=A0ACC3ZBB6_COLTU|nr:modin [Colletotrichum truncatum]KAF6787692.1 modin [Colletotrichum truncatum]
MSSNSANSTGADSGGDGGGKDNDAELFVAIVALVISVLAFVIAIFQALQQYYASATGYSSCTPKVIGDWAKFTRRIFKWYEFRFEVEFETPVIFVARPTNERGPLGKHDKKEITYMVGTTESYQGTYTWDQAEYNQMDENLRAGNTRQAIHTADNELANWLGLLMAIQRMENESRTWQDNEYFGHTPQWQEQTPCHPTPSSSPVTHTLSVGIQRKKKSWDSMPENMKKPYATTTISHLVEIAAMLGIYWKEFNRNEDRYRAQGNGFMITGYDVDDLGLVFTFQKTGPTWFQENRLIPHNSVKELCFGYCPTIFRQHGNDNYKYADEPKDIGTLQLGSMSAIAETLVVIGCNTNTVNSFRKPSPETRHAHIFPIAFELLGMIGVVLQIPGTAFRMLPNPTIWYWDRKSFSLRTFLSDFTHRMKEASTTDNMFTGIPQSCIYIINREAERIESKFEELKGFKRHQGIMARTQNDEERIYSNDLVIALHSAISQCDEHLQDPSRLTLVQNVLRVHFEEVLRILNDYESEPKVGAGTSDDVGKRGKQDLTVPGASPTHKTDEEKAETQKDTSLLQTLDSSSSSERHMVLVEIYLFSVRKKVIDIVCRQLKQERLRRERGARSIASEASMELLPKDQEQQISDIWCMLVFRMICWLLLHDFHGKDIQVEKSDIFGSRMPVYIT